MGRSSFDRIAICIVSVLLLGPLFGSAQGDELRSADEQIARGFFARGVVAYNAGHYADALVEFEAAARAKSSPAFDFNIARCHDRLNHAHEAQLAYERYLRGATDATDAREVRERLAVLRAEVATVRPQSARHASRYLTPAVAVAGGVALLAGVGGSLLGTAGADFRALQGACAPSCPAFTWSSLPAREHAGEALLGVAGALAVVDVVLFVLHARYR